jgi:hypothetical protein
MPKCTCRFCGGLIEYDESQEGGWGPCPHCDYQVKLVVKQAPLVDTTNQLPPRRAVAAVAATRKPPGRSRKGIIIVSSLTGIVLAGALVFVAGPWHKGPPPKPEMVHAKFGFSDKFLMVHNEDTFAWPAIEIYINGAPTTGFKFSLTNLAAGETATMELKKFTKDDGGQFKTSSMIITQIWIGGGGFKYQTYRP